MKARRIKAAVPVQVGDRNKQRLFLVPRSRVQSIVKLLSEFEVEGEPVADWRAPVQDLITANTEPGVILRGARAKEGISQTDLAAKLGIPQSNISEMESGKRTIGREMAKRLGKVLKIDYRVFL
jgi:DNA-binding XRE family transcriptional regulator